ncbi:hypothetical protein K8P10_001374 [Leucobacter sp. Psy1]|uniref:DUF3450 domain-containing protein n=1 Tax=Leucobacter sp. Psy1 TaxID=2875729 RepID=UPI001CD4E3E4|nr:DUF3450 domain-containing protein [Leucobacter sp. Psy1]UBH05863.1 hypothetical protein K8P10_001374 [Leucobacter sp. Psy1]
MATGYRAVLRLDDDQDAVRIVEEQLRSWLSAKASGRRATLETIGWEGQGVHRLGPDSKLSVVEEDDGRDASRRRLYRLVEENNGRTWTVSLFVASLPEARRHRQTIVVEAEVEGAGGDQAVRELGTPRIVPMILESIGAHDNETPLKGHPVVIRRGDVEQVIRAIEDEERTVSVVVAGSLGEESDQRWTEAIASLTKESVGIAATFVVYADAMEELQERLPASHAVDAGRVRTFSPHVDLDDVSDATRHRRLGPATFTRSLRGTRVGRPLQMRHAESTRRRLIELELPADVVRNRNVLRQAETRVLRDAAVTARVAEEERLQRSGAGPSQVRLVTSNPVREAQPDASAPDGSLFASLTALWERAAQSFARWLTEEEPSPSRLDELDRFIERKSAEGAVAQEQLDERELKVLELEDELTQLHRHLEDLEIDRAQSEQDIVSQQEELATLRQRIAASAQPQDAYVAPNDDVWGAPESVEELLNRITPGQDEHPVFKRVVFTGDESTALEIDRRYALGTYAPSLWQFIRVLCDYAELRESGEFTGSVHMYLNDDRVIGTKCSPNRHASTESETVLTNTKWREERVLPVPKAVSSDGLMLMDAHFKPPHRDTFAPRMHYYDDVSGTGKIYIGYMGKHLTNTKS